ncbi:exodeoxyribonuclease V subunit alpha [Vespertiliibacter pulmonis]|uniref:RecBCD enzyme subunit RecD n=1 Tax=Vespertiliibacter pulmonis TaxID=1443036 RepID=A0A3N4WJJ7_9PAST|nr:exodeoxyribonuclease V subunit alpha [Vespertiliibacter pulmonis]QLB20138.1 exodeoxyribonuclease V subunit alpha [Vespertiliibacter pulmonis]RPE86110.1 DNA helicase/exodeoxyribonuclease V alpha subunit [Vespertiliibacter pulmonis]
MLHILEQLKEENLISELNYQFAKLIDHQQKSHHYTQQQQNLAVLLSALMSYTALEGNSCLHLTSSLAQNPFDLTHKYAHFVEAISQKIGGISPLDWQFILQNHIAFSQNPEQIAPMLFQQERLYFYRYWQAENRVATYLQQAVSFTPDFTHIPLYQRILAPYFPEETETNWQKIAVATALQQKFSIISGGPGTGKTRTVAILLAALQQKQEELELNPLNIALVAPTGKAAARLKESISGSLLQLPLSQEQRNAIPINATTIHSLIGITPHRDKPRYNDRNPLNFDLIVVDEASMIDLFVMEKLFNALKPHTRVIMLGDKDQLASVEAGNIMSELGQFLHYGYSQTHLDYLAQTTGYTLEPQSSQVPDICNSLCHLRKSYRFDDNSGIGKLAKAINKQQVANSWQLFATPSPLSDLALMEYPSPLEFADTSHYQQQCIKLVITYAIEHYRDYLTLVKKQEQNPDNIQIIIEVFNAFKKVRLLTALRVSEFGVERLNQRIAEGLQQAGLIHFRYSRENYLGKPILITENAPILNLSSGDIGLVLADTQGKPKIYFEGETIDKMIKVTPSRLPSNEPAYVMTVHKSQGSEFEHTVLIMPLNATPILTKELLYTAVTRAKKKFTLFSNEKVWKQGIKSQTQRQSGLKEQILALN